MPPLIEDRSRGAFGVLVALSAAVRDALTTWLAEQSLPGSMGLAALLAYWASRGREPLFGRALAE